MSKKIKGIDNQELFPVGDQSQAENRVVNTMEEKMEGQKDNKSSNQKVIPAVGIDVGTANIVVTRQMEDGTYSIKHHRNMLFEMEVSDESTDLLSRGSYLYLQSKNKYYIVGEDALKIVNAIGRGTILRPMQNGMLNPELKTSQELLNKILETVVGKPMCADEPLRFSVPANPIDKPNVNNLFHQMVLSGFFNGLGFKAQPINEALANLYSEAPSMKADDGEVHALTGYSVSFGGGMVNSCFAFKGMSLIEFSSTACGDYIDAQVAQVTGESISRVIKIKENKLNLDDVDQGDNIQVALSIYYNEMISRVFKHIVAELSKERREFDGKVDVVVCGGSAIIPGFINRVKATVDTLEMPLPIKEIKLSNNPFFSVSQGCCLRARADYQKSQAPQANTKN